MKTKICSNKECLKKKPISEFNKQSASKDRLHPWCKECIKEHNKNYNEKFPWVRIFNNIDSRCNNPNHIYYKDYGFRGIENHLIIEDIKFLMKRDNYYKLQYPSIDRKDNDGNYTLDNSRFIELGINVAERNVRVLSKSILQYHLNGNFIKKWASGREIERILKISHGNISQCCKEKLKTSGGFRWKFKE